MEIRRLTVSDTVDLLRLVAGAGWNQTAADVARLIALEPEGCFAARVDGQIVGTTTTTTYGTVLGWVGMVLVDPSFRRQGIATALMRAAMEYLRERDVVTVKLDATPAGRPVYERLGFEPESILERWLGDSPTKGGDVATGQWAEVADLDRAAFAADRGSLVQRMIADSPTPLYVTRVGGRVTGYALARPGRRAGYVGPVVVVDESLPTALVSAAVAGLGGGPVYIDIDPCFPGALELMRALGFAPQRELLRMRRGPAIQRPGPARVFAIAGPAVG